MGLWYVRDLLKWYKENEAGNLGAKFVLNNTKSILSANNDFHLMLHTGAKWCFVLKLLSWYAGIRLKGYIIEGQGLREEIVSHLWSNYGSHIPTFVGYPHLRQARELLALVSRGRILMLKSYFKCGQRSWGGEEIIFLNLFSKGNIIRSSILFHLVVKHCQGSILQIWPWGLLLHGGIWCIARQSEVQGKRPLHSIV